ncbi:hypothetical protein FQN60_014693 [Etheostoma spectabile]|uniref:Tyrosine specific protein phosphatases domain-containing protein n=1 Tax=Etheostoma spectabile TaxID=54343 RepID=A0A5J5CSV8_9PERO|nr:hypothetical protein FQN60_014693 [Etheostoma spectabile]
MPRSLRMVSFSASFCWLGWITPRDIFSLFRCRPANPGEMHSLAQEIQGFSKNRLKKQCTCVTTVTGRRLLERRGDGGEGEEQVEELEEEGGCGFVEDKSLDLQVGVVRPFLLLASQDAAHDIDTLQRFKDGVVLVHCNAGVSRSSSVVIGYLMMREGLLFDDAYSQVKVARPSIRPNPGFYQQLQGYTP